MSEVHAQGKVEGFQLENRHLLQLADNLDELMVVLRLDGTCAWCNQSFARLLDTERDSLLGQAYPLYELREVMVSRPQDVVETWVQLKSGELRLIQFKAAAGLDEDGCVESVLVTGRDITAFHRLQNPLTSGSDMGLLPAAESQVQARIEHALDRAQRAQEYVGFMAIHISAGPELETDSSAVLPQLVDLVRQKIRQGDTLAQLDSGAYLLVLEQIDCPEAITTVVEKFSLLLQEHAAGHNDTFVINAGVAISPDDGLKAAELTDRAQQAMQRAIMNEERVCYF